MPLYRTAVGPDGMIKLPAGLREKLRIRDGCEVEFFLTVDGDVFFHAITSRAKDWKGAFSTELRSPPISITEMDAAIAEQVTEDDARILRQSKRARAHARRPAAE
jgi:bifunctional DNA-binding transcriptional regulator/antitoxin component of YhaV-PrlF toxin-antitoxin module